MIGGCLGAGNYTQPDQNFADIWRLRRKVVDIWPPLVSGRFPWKCSVLGNYRIERSKRQLLGRKMGFENRILARVDHKIWLLDKKMLTSFEAMLVSNSADMIDESQRCRSITTAKNNFLEDRKRNLRNADLSEVWIDVSGRDWRQADAPAPLCSTVTAWHWLAPFVDIA